MKKLLLLIILLITPLTIKAENNKLNVYLFKGEGCSHCEEALEWFNNLDDYTKNKFNLIQYEVWHNKDNHDLMKKVAEIMNDDPSRLGVPYIIIGKQSFIGFSATSQNILLNKINENDNSYDVMQNLDKKEESIEIITTNNDNKNNIIFNIVNTILIGIILFLSTIIFIFFKK